MPRLELALPTRIACFALLVGGCVIATDDGDDAGDGGSETGTASGASASQASTATGM